MHAAKSFRWVGKELDLNEDNGSGKRQKVADEKNIELCQQTAGESSPKSDSRG
jgi:hypothetical protein